MTSEDDATVTTLSESTKQSVHTLSRSEASEKFNKVGSNLRNLSYRHKKVEVGLECLETSVALQLNQLFRCFEFHHNRLERLEAAQDRQVAIQLKHMQLTLDPEAAQKDGTLASLQKLINKELCYSTSDKDLLEKDRSRTFDDTHEEDQEFVARKHKAGWLYDYYHNKLVDQDNESEFDINNLSDVSNDKKSASLPSEVCPLYEDTEKGNPRKPDEEMPDAKATPDFLTVSSQDSNEDQPVPSYGQQAFPKNASLGEKSRPKTWGSDDDDKGRSSPPITQEWLTTPTRTKSPTKLLKEPRSHDTRDNRHHPSLRLKATKLIKRAFSTQHENRFSVLDDDQPMDIPDISMISTAEESSFSIQDEDTSFQPGQQEESFDDDSFEENVVYF